MTILDIPADTPCTCGHDAIDHIFDNDEGPYGYCAVGLTPEQRCDCSDFTEYTEAMAREDAEIAAAEARSER